MTTLIRNDLATQLFEKYDNQHTVNYTDENGNSTPIIIGKKDGTIDRAEYQYALNDMYEKLVKNKSDEEYTKWMQEYSHIEQPITNKDEFKDLILKAFNALLQLAKK